MGDGPYRNTRSSSAGEKKTGCHFDTPTSDKKNSVFFMEEEGEGNSTPNRIIRQERVRTPSGHLIATPVQDIRNFFSKKADLGSPPPLNVVKSVKANRRNSTRRNLNENTAGHEINQSEQNKHNASVKGLTVRSKTVSKDNEQLFTEKDQGICVNLDQQLKKGSVSDRLQLTGNSQLADSFHTTTDTERTIKPNMSSDPKDPINGIIDPILSLENSADSDSTQPKVMDLKVLIQMFKEIKQELTQYKKVTENEILEGITSQQKTDTEAITNLQKDIKELKLKDQVKVSAIKGMAKTMKEMDKRIEDLERDKVRSNITISGLQLSEKWQDRKIQLQNFFWDTLNIAVEVKDSYVTGKEENPMVVVTVTNEMVKLSILESKKKLAGTTNDQGKGIYIARSR